MTVHPESVVPRSQSSSDEAWVVRLRSEEGDAVEEWVRSWAGPLLRLAYRYLRDEVASEKVVRDVLLRALQALSDGKSEAVSGTGLRHRTLDLALARLRSRSSGPGSIEALLPRFRTDGTYAEEPKPWRAEHRRLGDAGALSKTVWGCIERLPEPHRVVLILSEGERLEALSIAHHLEMTEERVKKTLHEGRLALRSLLDPQMRGTESEPERELVIGIRVRQPKGTT